MSASFQPILWNRQKIRYDITFVSVIILYVVIFFVVNTILYPTITAETMLIRSFGTLAFLMLQVILSIGPLARFNPKFLVLLYNRRHLGVSMFLMASVHAVFSIIQFHGNGNIHPLLSIFLSNTHYTSFLFFPFQTLGFAAYLILMLMAFTSHDFWLSVLSPKAWKTLHIVVYLAYFLLVLHVLLGVIQLESSPVYFGMLLLSVLWVAGIHVIAGLREWKFDHTQPESNEGWVKVCDIKDMVDSKAKMIDANDERIAIFRYGNKISAVHNVCKHQNGPLGEGKIVDGCITCPWHGYQYAPANGCAPAPFTEKVATYHTQIKGTTVWLKAAPLAEGTYVEPTIIPTSLLNDVSSTQDSPFYIGWQAKADKLFGNFALRWSSLITVGALICALLVSFNQKHIAISYFNENMPPRYVGQLMDSPFTALRTLKGKDVYGNPIIATIPLVNPFKFGAGATVADFLRKHPDCPTVEVVGTTITSEGVDVIQLDNEGGSISCGKSMVIDGKDSACCPPKPELSKKAGDKSGNPIIQEKKGSEALPPIHPQTLGSASLTGEIIDSKCYFGTMNPGEGKPHRSCAIRCIEGGIIPMIKYTNKKGQHEFAILLGAKGEAINNKIAFAVGQPIQATGQLWMFDNWKVLYLKEGGIKRERE